MDHIGRGRVAELVPEVIKRGYLVSTAPLVRVLLRSRISPNLLTTVGAALILVSSVAYGFGAIRWGGLLLLLSGLVDTLDGQVARQGAQTSKFGAFYDSTLDRVGDGATFIGIAAYLLRTPDVRWRDAAILCCMAGILTALLVSYMRARAEGLGLECTVGVMQRAERIIGLGLPSLIFGAGPEALVLTGIVAVLTLFSIITVGQRFVHVHRATARAGAP